MAKEDIGFLLKLIHDGVGRVFHQEVGKGGPTRAQLKVLEYLYQHDGEKVLVKDVMDHLRVDQSTASGIIKRMERDRYLVSRQDPEDRRQKLLLLGPAGKGSGMDRAHREAARIEETLRKGLTDRELEELRRMLIIIYKNLMSQ